MKTGPDKNQLAHTLGLIVLSILFLPSLANNSSAHPPLTLFKEYTVPSSVSPTSYTSAAGSLSDERLAALTIYLESRGESFAGKLAVAAVIRNRMKAQYQSDGTVKGTVLKRLQFEPWNQARPEEARFAKISEARMRDSLLAWRMVQDGRDVVQGALLFYNPRLVVTPHWATVSHKVASIGRHEFYVPPGKRNI